MTQGLYNSAIRDGTCGINDNPHHHGALVLGLHKLFDEGYLTVDPQDRRIAVSSPSR